MLAFAAHGPVDSLRTIPATGFSFILVAEVAL
jgi:hypothetical protein